MQFFIHLLLFVLPGFSTVVALLIERCVLFYFVLLNPDNINSSLATKCITPIQLQTYISIIISIKGHSYLMRWKYFNLNDKYNHCRLHRTSHHHLQKIISRTYIRSCEGVSGGRRLSLVTMWQSFIQPPCHTSQYHTQIAVQSTSRKPGHLLRRIWPSR